MMRVAIRKNLKPKFIFTNTTKINKRHYSTEDDNRTWKEKMIERREKFINFLGFSSEDAKEEKFPTPMNISENITEKTEKSEYISNANVDQNTTNVDLPISNIENPSNIINAQSAPITPAQITDITPPPEPQVNPFEIEPKKFPPSASYFEFMIVCVIATITFIYAYFAARDSAVEDTVTEIRWGGELDQLEAFNKINRWLTFESYLGVKVSNRLVLFGAVEEILGVIATPRSEKVRHEAAKLLCKLTKNKRARDILNREGAIDVLRNHVSANDLYVIYTLANLSEDKEHLDRILSDDNLIGNLLYTFAYSLKRGQFEDNYVQRGLLRLFSNAITNSFDQVIPYSHTLDNLLVGPMVTDTINWVYITNIVTKLKEESNAKKFFPNMSFLMQMSISNVVSDPNRKPQDKEKILRLAYGASVVGIVSFIMARCASKLHLSDFAPLNLYQKKWLRYQSWKVPFVSIPLFLMHFGLSSLATKFSNYLEFDPANGVSKSESFFGGFDWQKNNSRALPVLTAIHLIRLPIYYYAIKLSPFAFIPSLIPWHVDKNSPPDWSIKYYVPAVNHVNDVIFKTPKPDPTPAEIEAILDGREQSYLDYLLAGANLLQGRLY